TGYCRGIENYSRHLESREPGLPPFTLIDYFKFCYGENFLTFLDESHIGVPQLRGMHAGDRSRKETLIKYGFRLPSALDNRPLKFGEFEKLAGQTIYVSATPSEYELQKSQLGNGVSKLNEGVVEQLIRPTGLLDPEIEVRPTKNQIVDLINEIKKRIAKKQRVLATVLTKRLSEELADFLEEAKIKARFLHSEIHTLERTEILRDLRLGEFDVLVGVNLLREGLDLPEVSLVAILDADKEGFLRNATTLIQTSGRAARHQEGKVIMYADKITKSMAKAIEETERRRKIQEDYNKKHNIVPKTIKKEIRENIIARNGGEEKNKYSVSDYRAEYGSELPLNPEKAVNRQIIAVLKKELKDAVKKLDFEKAAYFRDEIKRLAGSE
ncbi:MAG: helicase-related protein, partial [Patescibacteria group bacterium]